MNLTGMELQIIEWVVYLQETKEIVLTEYCNDLDDRELNHLIKGTGSERLIESRALQIVIDFLNQKTQVS
ncbi:hypothetical protein ACQ1P6_08845 [Streptococcus pasteurianus]